jgi:hypothetical protein
MIETVIRAARGCLLGIRVEARAGPDLGGFTPETGLVIDGPRRRSWLRGRVLLCGGCRAGTRYEGEAKRRHLDTQIRRLDDRLAEEHVVGHRDSPRENLNHEGVRARQQGEVNSNEFSPGRQS